MEEGPGPLQSGLVAAFLWTTICICHSVSVNILQDAVPICYVITHLVILPGSATWPSLTTACDVAFVLNSQLSAQSLYILSPFLLLSIEACILDLRFAPWTSYLLRISKVDDVLIAVLRLPWHLVSPLVFFDLQIG